MLNERNEKNTTMNTMKRMVIGLLGAGLLLGPDPAPDPALPRIDDSGRKPGTATSLDPGHGAELDLVWIPAGEFMMGSPTNEPGRDMQERLHRVKLTKGFWMGKYEVTQEQWQRVMGNNPSWFTNAGPKAPVETVRYDQAQKFRRKLGEMTAGKDGAGGKFRLPTEAEWEWACRAGTDQALHNGKVTIKGANNGPELNAIAWYGGNSGVEYEGGSLSLMHLSYPDADGRRIPEPGSFVLEASRRVEAEFTLAEATRT